MDAPADYKERAELGAVVRKRASVVTASFAVFALIAVPEVSAAASSLRYEAGLLLFRGPSIGLGIRGEPGEAGAYFAAFTLPDLDIGPGCGDPLPTYSTPPVEVRCPVMGAGLPRYRIDQRHFPGGSARAPYKYARGVIFGGPGPNEADGDVVYGGGGDDTLAGVRVHGGAGDDRIFRVAGFGPTMVRRGGAGNDEISGPGWGYGGPGNDFLEEADIGRGDMLVGGPGSDRVEMGDDSTRDVVRLRGGGRDTLYCHQAPDPEDLFYVDRADRVSPTCRTAHVLLTGRTRSLTNFVPRGSTP